MTIGYLRVSSKHQSLLNQKQKILDYGCKSISLTSLRYFIATTDKLKAVKL